MDAITYPCPDISWYLSEKVHRDDDGSRVLIEFFEVELLWYIYIYIYGPVILFLMKMSVLLQLLSFN